MTERPTVLQLLERRASTAPGDTAVWFEDTPVTFGCLWDRTRQLAAGLAERGLERGDRYAIFMGNCREFAESWFGAMLLGALAVPINTALRGEFLAHQLRDSKARFVVTDDEGRAAVAEVADSLPDLATVLIKTDSELPVLRSVETANLDDLYIDSARDQHVDPSAADLATVIYTSGTTGLPKGVLLSHNYLALLGSLISEAEQLSSDDTIYLPLPMFHLSGMSGILTTLTVGSTSVIDRRFSVSATWERVRARSCTGAVFVGPMIAMLWALPPSEQDSSLGLRFIGGAPIPAGLERDLSARYGCDLVTLYGMTEVFPIATARVGEEFPAGSSGRVNPALTVKVVDESEHEVPAGRPGEVLIRAQRPHTMFEGYLGFDSVGTRDGWFHTGDLCAVDGDGFLYFVDRKKDALRRRGENISSVELETAIRRHPGVADVAVVGVPSEFGEDDVKAVIVPSEDDVTTHELFGYFEEHLPSFALPRYVELISSLPRNQVGRVLKHQLRETALNPNTIDRTLERSS